MAILNGKFCHLFHMLFAYGIIRAVSFKLLIPAETLETILLSYVPKRSISHMYSPLLTVCKQVGAERFEMSRTYRFAEVYMRWLWRLRTDKSKRLIIHRLARSK